MHPYPESIDPYDSACANVFVRAEHLARYLYATEYIRKNRLKAVLDAACGDGYGCRALAAAAERVAGAERSDALMKKARRLSGELSIQNIEYRIADLNEGLPFIADGSFDCAVCFETLEHVERDEALLLEFRRVLRRGGRLLLSVPKEGYEPVDASGRPANPHHLRLYGEEGLRALLEGAGFTVEKMLGQPYANISRVYTADYCRDKSLSSEQVEGFFSDSPEAMEFYARVWGWPTAEAFEKSNVIFMVCRKNG